MLFALVMRDLGDVTVISEYRLVKNTRKTKAEDARKIRSQKEEKMPTIE